MRPPGGGASTEKVSTFRNHLHRTLEKGERVELSAWGAPASQNTIHAFATCSKAVQFQVRWQQKESVKEHCLHFIAKCFLPWEEYLQNRIMNTKSIPVQAETRPLDLARSIASVLQRNTSESRAVRVYAPLADEAAVHILAKGLASAPSLHPFKSLKTVCNIVTPMDDPTSRLFAYLTFAEQEDVPDAGAGIKVFHAYPPGNADQDTAFRFISAVQDRLQMGNEVKMNCRGPDAVMHAIRSFCLLKGHVAEFRVAWASADTPEETSKSSAARALLVEAVRGPSWQEFNSIDFNQTHLLKVSGETPVGKLAYAVIAEVRAKGAVSVHCYSDNKYSVGVLMKALATVRSISGKQVRSIPSYGRARHKGSPVLRVYVQRCQHSLPESADEETEKAGVHVGMLNSARCNPGKSSFANHPPLNSLHSADTCRQGMQGVLRQ